MDDSLQVDLKPGLDADELRRGLDAGRDAILENCDKAFSKLSWPWLRGRIATVIDDLRDQDFAPWLGKAWAEYDQLRKYKDEARYPRDTELWHDMDPHRLEAMLHPSMTIRCYGAEIGTLQLDAGVVADIHAISLHILNGEIIGFRAGEYGIRFDVSCNGAPLCKPIELDAGRLVSQRSFAHPIAII